MRWFASPCPTAALIAASSLLVSCFATRFTEGVSRTSVVPGSLSKDSVTVIAGSEYEAGGFHRFFFGDHYRDLWTTPARVRVLNLQDFAGGLTPTEAGGGFQTKSLRFTAGDGRTFKFRSVDKNPRAVLPLELRGTIAGDLAQDHISTSNPAAAVIVDELAGATGVPRLGSMLVYLPDDERLGEFRDSFGGLLGIFELYPAKVPDQSAPLVPEYLRRAKIRNALEMYQGMEEDSEDRPDAVEYLRARFLDVLVGDWDRHVKQWKWVQRKEDGKKRWYPVPMDRDQAMVKLDGVFPSLAAMAISQFSDFAPGVPDVDKITFSGQYLDRRLLSGLGRQTWDSLARVFLTDLSDEAIDRAVKRLPPEYYRFEGERLISILKSRRDSFMETEKEYYDLLAGYVDIFLSDKREYVAIRRTADGNVLVESWRRDKDTGGPDPARRVFSRLFLKTETVEIRVYMLGGDDRVEVSGEVPSSIPVRIVGGKGDDEFADESVVDGVLWGFVPFVSSAETMTYFYDSQGNNRFAEGPGTVIDEEMYQPPPGGITQY